MCVILSHFVFSGLTFINRVSELDCAWESMPLYPPFFTNSEDSGNKNCPWTPIGWLDRAAYFTPHGVHELILPCYMNGIALCVMCARGLGLLTSNNYASPTSGEAYRNRRLTTNFELWVEIFCVPTCFHMRIPKPCLSVRPSVHLSVPREKKSS